MCICLSAPYVQKSQLHLPERNIKLLEKLFQCFVITPTKTDLFMVLGFELLLAWDVPVFLVSKHQPYFFLKYL